MHHSGSHDPLLVALSIFIAAAASFTALDLFHRARPLSGVLRHGWIAAAALALGGGIWAMHFVAMLAFSVPGMPVRFDVPLTALSFLLPIGVTGLAFQVVAAHPGRPAPLISSGVLMGIGIAFMHYTGMTAMRMPGQLQYSPPWVVISVAIAIAAATAALWIAAQNTRIPERVFASVLMGFAIAGMHYSAMQGVTISHLAVEPAELTGLELKGLADWVTGVTLLILVLAIAASALDRRLALRMEHESAKLRASEERFRLLLKSVTDYAIFMLDEHGRVANWNTGAERIKGYTADEIVGRHFSDFYTQEDRDAGLPAHALRTAAESGRFEHEGWRLRKDGTRYWASVVIDPVRDDDGKLVGFAKITRDITDRKQAHEALEQAREALFQAQKMEAIGQLTGGVAHDFNNLLMAVLGSLELLRKRLPEDPRSHRLLDNAVAGAKRGAALTQRMLAFARRQELKLEAIDVAELVRGMTDLLERTINADVRINTQFPLRLPPALADPHQLELAVLNLVVNARDAMAQGGTIAISAQADGIAPPSDLGPGDYVCLSVEDTGAGMDPEILAKAQEPFFTTKGVGKGTGLGLPMVRGVAEQSGGGFRLISQPGKGTRAEIWLPRASPQTQQRGVEPQTERATSIHKELTIMVVDDDPLVLENTSAMLDDIGHRVVEARSGEEALRVLARAGRLDLIISDQVMPGMNGLELLTRARTIRPGVPGILASGYAELGTGEASGVPRLAKPFDQAALRMAINDALSDAGGNVLRLQPQGNRRS